MPPALDTMNQEQNTIGFLFSISNDSKNKNKLCGLFMLWLKTPENTNLNTADSTDQSKYLLYLNKNQIATSRQTLYAQPPDKPDIILWWN